MLVSSVLPRSGPPRFLLWPVGRGPPSRLRNTRRLIYWERIKYLKLAPLRATVQVLLTHSEINEDGLSVKGGYFSPWWVICNKACLNCCNGICTKVRDLSTSSSTDLQYSLERSVKCKVTQDKSCWVFLQSLILIIHAEKGSGSGDVAVEAI